MQWAKAKTIMIWLFLAVDIILAVILASEKISFDGSREKNLSAVLKNNKLNVRSELLDNEITNIFAYEFKGLMINDDIAAVFLKNPVKIDGSTYSNEAKTARLYSASGRISYENEEPSFKGFSNVTEKNVNAKLSPYLKALKINKYVRLTKVFTENEDIYAEYSYFFGNTELFLSSIIFKVNKNGIKKISGEINIPNGKSGYNFTLSSIETILMNFVQNNKFQKEETVVSINLGYYCINYENILFSQAIPVYRIKTTDKIYIYDARDGIDAVKRQLWSE